MRECGWRQRRGPEGRVAQSSDFAAFVSNDEDWSGRPGSNRGPPAPKAGALPGCATPRLSPNTTKLPQSRRFPRVRRFRCGPLVPRRMMCRLLHAFDNPLTVLLPLVTMSAIADAIAERESQIERLQAEIKALSDVEKMLGGSAPQARRRPRRPSSPRKPAAAAAEAAPEAKPRRKRRQMTPEEKKAVSERMTAYWAARRKKAGK